MDLQIRASRKILQASRLNDLALIRDQLSLKPVPADQLAPHYWVFVDFCLFLTQFENEENLNNRRKF